MMVFLVILHVIVCVALIMIVLLQTGKGADIGAALAAAAAARCSGPPCLHVLSKATT